MNGENVGCVMLVKENGTTARLRLLLVDPKARGMGLGARLVDECVTFCAGDRLQIDYAMDAQRTFRRTPHL